MGIEQEFQLTVDTDEVEGIKTVGDAVELIKNAKVNG